MRRPVVTSIRVRRNYNGAVCPTAHRVNYCLDDNLIMNALRNLVRCVAYEVDVDTRRSTRVTRLREVNMRETSTTLTFLRRTGRSIVDVLMKGQGVRAVRVLIEYLILRQPFTGRLPFNTTINCLLANVDRDVIGDLFITLLPINVLVCNIVVLTT